MTNELGYDIATVDEQRAECVRVLKAVGISGSYIQRFEKGIVFLSGIVPYVLVDIDSIHTKISYLEKEYGVMVYAVTHELTSFGECFSFLCVPKYRSDFEQTNRPYNKSVFQAFAYVWNMTHEECSEFGSVFVVNDNDLLTRVG